MSNTTNKKIKSTTRKLTGQEKVNAVLCGAVIGLTITTTYLCYRNGANESVIAYVLDVLDEAEMIQLKK